MKTYTAIMVILVALSVYTTLSGLVNNLEAGTPEPVGIYSTKQGAYTEIMIPQHTLGYKNNNPFNLRYVGQAESIRGIKGFAKFTTMEDGIMAGYKQIFRDADRGHTIKTFLNKYAPPVENDTGNYIRFICCQLGCTPDTLLTDVNQFRLGVAMMKMECGAKEAQ